MKARKDLLGIRDLEASEILEILEVAKNMKSRITDKSKREETKTKEETEK